MPSSPPETFGERPQKEPQSGSGSRVDPPGLEFVRAVKELLEMGAAVMENPSVSDFITSTYHGLMDLADDSYPGNDIEWHESLSQESESDPDEDDPQDDEEDDDFDEHDADADDDEDPESLDDPDDGLDDEEEDDYDDDEVHRPGRPRSKPISEDDEPVEDDQDGDDLTPDDSEDASDDEDEEGDDALEDDDEDQVKNPKSRKMMAKLVTSLKGLSSEFQRFNNEFRRMKGKVD
jgi:hypothetical protein